MNIGIIGCGHMGSAIARGILSKKILPFNNIYVSDRDPSKTKALHKEFGIRLVTNEDATKKASFLIIAVKPQDHAGLLKSLSGQLDNKKHLISVMAGITISKIESLIGKKIAVTRAMPNMAALVGKSVTCLSHNRMVKEKSVIHRIFSAIGHVMEIEEKYMDAVTAVSGSGPAYFFYFVECLKEAAMKLGIKKEIAHQLAVDTLVGSAALLETLGVTPEVLRERVTSKGGSTESALKIFNSKKLKESVIEAVKAGNIRSKELSKGV